MKVNVNIYIFGGVLLSSGTDHLLSSSELMVHGRFKVYERRCWLVGFVSTVSDAITRLEKPVNRISITKIYISAT